MLSIATLGSGGVLAAGIAGGVPVLSADEVQTLSAKRAPGKSLKKSQRTDSGRNKADTAKVQAVAGTPVLPHQDDGSALTLPVQQNEVLPADNKVQSLALKGVRG